MGAYDMIHVHVHVHVPWFVFATCSLILSV